MDVDIVNFKKIKQVLFFHSVSDLLGQWIGTVFHLPSIQELFDTECFKCHLKNLILTFKLHNQKINTLLNVSTSLSEALIRRKLVLSSSRS